LKEFAVLDISYKQGEGSLWRLGRLRVNSEIDFKVVESLELPGTGMICGFLINVKSR
jgi:hypothetical protein